MNAMFRMLGLLLVAALVITATASNAASPFHHLQASSTASLPARAAGCHTGALPGAPAPANSPIEYQCCIAGHETAIPPSSDLPSPDLASAHFEPQPQPTPPSFANNFETRALPSTGPPVESPLRI
jgi:hypothetical protein